MMTERMTSKQFLKEGASAASSQKANKYGAKTITVGGHKFDSKREAKRWCELKVLERQEHITNLRRQVKIYLEGRDGPLLTRSGRRMKITVDFAYTELRDDARFGETIYEDSKGTPTRDYEVRRAVAAAQGIHIKEV